MPFLSGLESFVRPGVTLAPYTWFQMGGPAEYFATPRTAEEAALVLQRCLENELPWRILGGGSNVLIREAGVPGVVIHLDAPELSQIAVSGTRVTAGAGGKLGHAISVSVGEGLAGLEPLVGIPGTVGGAIRKNAGTRGGDIGQWVSKVTVLNARGELIERSGDEIVFAYRQSNLDDLLLLSAEFDLEQDDPAALAKRMQKQWINKKSAQPLGHERTGCIFRNPRGMSAGILIEQCGLKGARIGGAEVSQRHGNFIVVDPGASSQDILRLATLVRSRVAERMAVELDMELEVW